MSSDNNGTRIYFQAKNPNPLFVEWLEYWIKQAEEKDSMKKYTLAKALESLRKYPLVLYSGRDCAILDGFGNGICKMIDKQLEVYRSSNPGQLLDEKQMDVKEKSIIFDIKTTFDKKRAKQSVITDFDELVDFKEKLDDTLEAFLADNAFDPDIAMPLAQPSASSSDYTQPKVKLEQGNFKIILLVDTQETAG